MQNDKFEKSTIFIIIITKTATFKMAMSPVNQWKTTAFNPRLNHFFKKHSDNFESETFLLEIKKNTKQNEIQAN